MTKRKTSRKNRQEDATFADTSEEELDDASGQRKSCPHVTKAVNFGRLKKGLKTATDLNICMGCAEKDKDDSEDSVEVWMCLQCAYRGCGRNSANKHAIQHNKTLHSDCHSVVLSISSGILWCYDCDSEIQLSTSNLRQCVDFIKKFTSKKENNFVSKNVNKQSNSQSVKESSPAMEKSLIVKNVPADEPKKVLLGSKKSNSVVPKSQIKGLRNLGNTCFFNAVMQNLSQTPLLEHELKTSSNPEYLWEVPHLLVRNGEIIEEEDVAKKLRVSLPKQHPMSHALFQFLKQMTLSTGSKIEIINPSSLFGEISKKSPQFRHFQQQDSHELLRQLLDGVRQEEIKRQKKGILKAFKLENISPESINEETRKLVKAYGCYASHTIVEKIFGGLLISTVLCEECKMSSQVFEPFMDLSLPLFEEKPTRNTKVDKESDENADNEFLLIKEKHDVSKPSKHQEKKMKQQAKKAKKKIRILRHEKPNLSNDTTIPPVPENFATLGNNASKEELLPEEQSGNEVSDSTADGKEESVNDKHTGMEDNEIKLQDDDAGPSNEAPDEIDNFENKSIPTESVLHENELVLSHEATETSATDLSVSTINDSLDMPQDEAKEVQGIHGGSDVENSTALEDRLQVLCSQIKDIRIRRDSDRQENFLDSSRSVSDCESQRLNTSHESIPEDTNTTENGDNWSRSLSEQHTKEWIMRSLTTLKQRNPPSPLECSINSCLSHFTKSELLTGSNKFRCENCTNMKRKKMNSKTEVAYTNASKQLLIFSPPAILTLHLKRFQQVGMSLKKVNRFVEFPPILDLAPYCSSASLILPHMAAAKDEVIYSLYGVVEHSGRLTSGHYTAFIKVSQRTVNHSFMNQLPLGQCDLEQLLQKFSKINSIVEENASRIDCDEDSRWFYVSDGHVREVNESEVLKCQAYIMFYQRIK